MKNCNTTQTHWKSARQYKNPCVNHRLMSGEIMLMDDGVYVMQSSNGLVDCPQMWAAARHRDEIVMAVDAMRQ